MVVSHNVRFEVCRCFERQVMHRVANGLREDMIEPAAMTVRSNEENMPLV